MTLSCPPNCIKGTPLWELYDVSDTNPEFCLYESVIMEYTDVTGFPIMYYRAKSKMDRLYGEDSNQNYHPAVKTKLFYEPTEEKNIIDALGIRSDETIQYSLMPKGTFLRDIGGTITGIPTGIINAVGGTSYSSKMMVPTTGGTGTGLYVDIITASGSIVKITINTMNAGSGYSVGDIIAIDGGNDNASFEIASVKSNDIGPLPGDVIKTLWNNRNYEIVDIGAEENIFMAKKLVWEFILRPFRFSEQSLVAEEIHRSRVAFDYIYIYPDGETADITYADGTTMNDVPVGDLGLDIAGMSCGVRYKRNEDGSFEILKETLQVELETFPHPTYEETGKPLEDKLEIGYGDNSWIEVESNRIDSYGDMDDMIFQGSSVKAYPMAYGQTDTTPIAQSDINGYSIINAINGEIYDIQFVMTTKYIYIVTPVQLNNISFIINGLSVIFVQSVGNYLIGGESYTCNVYRSQYKVTGNVTINVTIEED